MMGKLIRYDMKSMSRAFIPMWILAPVVSLMLSISIRGMFARTSGDFMVAGNGIVFGIMMLLFMGVMVGLFVMTLLFVIQRFWNGLLKDEGYLMFTLPVETWELIISKAITATIITCISVVDGIFSCIILAIASTDDIIREFARAWEYFLKDIVSDEPYFWLLALLSIIWGIFSISESIYKIYTAMALGQLFESHRIIGSCVCYVGIGIILSIIGGITSIIISFSHLEEMYYANSNELFGFIYLSTGILLTVIRMVIFHVITERLLSTRLNLE